MREKLEAGWLRVNLVIEIMGKPTDYIEKVLDLAIDKLSKEKKVEIVEKKNHKAEPVEKIFTCFTELGILVENLSRLIEIIFDYMPSSVEIVEPLKLEIKIDDANALLNELTLKIHQYDSVTKQLRLERGILLKKLEELMGKKGEGKEGEEVKEDEEKES